MRHQISVWGSLLLSWAVLPLCSAFSDQGRAPLAEDLHGVWKQPSGNCFRKVCGGPQNMVAALEFSSLNAYQSSMTYFQGEDTSCSGQPFMTLVATGQHLVEAITKHRVSSVILFPKLWTITLNEDLVPKDSSFNWPDGSCDKVSSFLNSMCPCGSAWKYGQQTQNQSSFSCVCAASAGTQFTKLQLQGQGSLVANRIYQDAGSAMVDDNVAFHMKLQNGGAEEHEEHDDHEENEDHEERQDNEKENEKDKDGENEYKEDKNDREKEEGQGNNEDKNDREKEEGQGQGGEGEQDNAEAMDSSSSSSTTVNQNHSGRKGVWTDDSSFQNGSLFLDEPTEQSTMLLPIVLGSAGGLLLLALSWYIVMKKQQGQGIQSDAYYSTINDPLVPGAYDA